MTMVLYLLATAVLRWFWGSSPTDDVPAVPSAMSIVMVIYLSFSIDIFASLVRVLQCKDFSSAVDPSHIYAAYDTVGSGERWMGDTEVHCWTGAHLWSAVAAVAGLVVSVGVLLFIVGIVTHGKRKSKLGKPKFIIRYGFLYLAYRKDGIALYWEAIITLRKMLLAAADETGQYKETSGAQIGLSAMMIIAFLALHEMVQPFENSDMKDVFPSYAGSVLRYFGAKTLSDWWVAFNHYVSLNGLESASLAMSLTIFLTAGCVNDEKSQSTDSNILISVCFMLNVFFVFFMLYRLWYGAHHILDVLAKEKGVPCSGGGGSASEHSYDLTRICLVTKAWIVFLSRPQEDWRGETRPAVP